MFCKYCGKEIADDSKFCSNCGRALEHFTVMGVHSMFAKIWSKFREHKKLGYIYGLWFSLNLGLLLLGNNGRWISYANPLDDYERHWTYLNPNSSFYPENGLDDIDIYDIEEFVFYTFLLPFILWLGFLLYKYCRNKMKK